MNSPDCTVTSTVPWRLAREKLSIGRQHYSVLFSNTTTVFEQYTTLRVAMTPRFGDLDVDRARVLTDHRELLSKAF